VFLLNFFKRYLNTVFAIILSSAVFACFHYTFVLMPYFFIVGTVLAILYAKTKTIIPSMVTHSLFNFIIISLQIMFFLYGT
jgi:hypothetical protein